MLVVGCQRKRLSLSLSKPGLGPLLNTVKHSGTQRNTVLWGQSSYKKRKFVLLDTKDLDELGLPKLPRRGLERALQE